MLRPTDDAGEVFIYNPDTSPAALRGHKHSILLPNPVLILIRFMEYLDDCYLWRICIGTGYRTTVYLVTDTAIDLRKGCGGENITGIEVFFIAQTDADHAAEHGRFIGMPAPINFHAVSAHSTKRIIAAAPLRPSN